MSLSVLKPRRLVILSLLFTLLTFHVLNAGAQSTISYSAGAVGNPATVGSLGFGVSIQTHAYDIDTPDLPGRADAFWVGATLTDGGFIQFGYGLQQGNICLNYFVESNNTSICKGGEYVTNGDPRWFWSYYPQLLGSSYYFQMGPTMSGGLNGTWHNYWIADNANQSWSFILDGVPVASSNIKPSPSSIPPEFAVEQVTSGNLGRLGPVEFRNLSYFKSGIWRPVDSLTPFKSCGLKSTCPLQNPYNVTFLGENDAIVGSLKPLPSAPLNSSTTNNVYFITAAILSLSVIILVSRYAIRRKQL